MKQKENISYNIFVYTENNIHILNVNFAILLIFSIIKLLMFNILLNLILQKSLFFILIVTYIKIYNIN